MMEEGMQGGLVATPHHARDCLLIPVCHLLPYKYYRLHNPSPPSLPCQSIIELNL